jgi:hypothetical protein
VQHLSVATGKLSQGAFLFGGGLSAGCCAHSARPGHHAGCEALQAGTAQGYRQAGLAVAPLELTRALLWALEQPSAGEHWLAGKDVPTL